jgi:hypothetical protein
MSFSLVGGKRKKRGNTRRRARKGGNMLSRAVVPFGLLAINQVAHRNSRRRGRKSRKARRGSRK